MSKLESLNKELTSITEAEKVIFKGRKIYSDGGVDYFVGHDGNNAYVISSLNRIFGSNLKNGTIVLPIDQAPTGHPAK